MTNRLFIDAQTGVVELEGEKEFVKEHFEKLLPLIELCGFGKGADVPERDDNSGGTPESTPEASTDAPPASSKRTRRSVVRAPKGQSCRERILKLRADGFFKEKRTIGQIVEGLARKGWTHNSGQVAAAAGQSMFSRGEIRRTKTGNAFEYFWDWDSE